MQKYGKKMMNDKQRPSKTALCRTLFGCLLICVISCPKPVEEIPNGKLRVFVSIPPYVFFVERIGADHVAVDSMVEGGQDPHTYEPLPRQMVRLTRAKIFFKAGMPYEGRVLKNIASSYGELKIVDVNRGIEKLEGRGHEGHDVKLETDPHTWLSPRLAVKIAENICSTLIEVDPENKLDYEKNLVVFINELERLDTRIKNKLKARRGDSFFVFHPAYGYFAREYALRQIAVEHDGKAPGTKKLVALVDDAEKFKVKYIIIQARTPKSMVMSIAENIGAEILVVDPLEKNYFKNIENLSDAINKALVHYKNYSGSKKKNGEKHGH